MFDWDRFKKGEIAVHCDNEEKAKDFLTECKDEGIKWSSGRDVTYRNNWESYEKDTCYCCFDGDSKLGYSDYEFYIREGKEIIKWEVKEMKELTFKEVIANIKEGEVWESDYKTVEIKGSVLEITDKDRKIRLRFGDDTQFKLQRKEYTFEEAFKAYEEGKAIESFKGTSYVKHYEEEYFEKISIEEIRGKWYIND